VLLVIFFSDEASFLTPDIALGYDPSTCGGMCHHAKHMY
jgi:hypothetical protein